MLNADIFRERMDAWACAYTQFQTYEEYRTALLAADSLIDGLAAFAEALRAGRFRNRLPPHL